MKNSRPLPEHLKAEVAALEAMSDEEIDYSDAPSLDGWSEAARGRFADKSTGAAGDRIKLPEQVARIFEAVAELEEIYQRKFTVDGHLLGSIGEVVAKEALGLTLYPMSHPNHDAHDGTGHVQIKITARNSVAMYGPTQRLLVLKLRSSSEAEIVYDGPGQLPWDKANKPGKKGQRVITLTKLKALSAA